MINDILWSVFWFLLLIVLLAFYALPTIVAFRRGHPNRWVILAINMVGGGTGFLWFICLIWAFHAIHLSTTAGGSDGGESGLNLAVNDVRTTRVIPDKTQQLATLKSLLDSGGISQIEFQSLKSEVLGIKSLEASIS